MAHNTTFFAHTSKLGLRREKHSFSKVGSDKYEHREVATTERTTTTIYATGVVMENSTLLSRFVQEDKKNNICYHYLIADYCKHTRGIFKTFEYENIRFVENKLSERVALLGTTMPEDLYPIVRKLSTCFMSYKLKDVCADYASDSDSVMLEVRTVDDMTVRVRYFKNLSDAEENECPLTFKIYDKGQFIYSGEDEIETFGENLAQYAGIREEKLLGFNKQTESLPEKATAIEYLPKECRYKPIAQIGSSSGCYTPKCISV